MMTNLRARTIGGLGWSAVAQIVRQVLLLGVSIILARTLGPRAIGLIGMVLVFTSFVTLFSDLGLGPALIQKPTLEPRHLTTAFWTNLATGLLFTLVIAAAAPLIAAFYGEPLLQPVVVVMSCNFFIISFRSVQQALFQKHMEFRQLAIVDVSAVVVAGVVATAMALTGWGVWSLVAQLLLTSVTTVVLLWVLSSWKPSFAFDRGALREMLGFGLNLTGFQALNYWSRNADDLLVGRFLGPAALGIYSLAYQWMLLPVTQMSSVITRVMFPALSLMQDDQTRVRHAYLYATRIIAFVAFPLMIGLLVVAEPFVLTLYGSEWVAAIPVLQILCLQGMSQAVGTTVGWIYMSQGRTNLMFHWGIFASVIRVTAFVIGLNWGVVGVAAAYVISGYAILWYPSWKIPGRLINLTFARMVHNLAGVFWCTCAMGTAVWAVGWLLPEAWSPWVHLAIQVPCGMIVYTLLVYGFKVRAYQDVRALIDEQIRERRRRQTDIPEPEGIGPSL
jgi:PST family polysaccharide transporter